VCSDSAPHAIEHLTEIVDVVLSDVRMDGLSGLELMRIWKKRRDTPFILLTAFGDIPAAVEDLKAGADDYPIKPFEPSELLRRVETCLAEAGQKQRELQQPREVSLQEMERVAIENALEAHAGNRTRAARSLGISVRTLQRKLKAWDANEYLVEPPR
jgi:DNA-binding NtrC family response regulator